ncbi:MAG: endonuclease/exonuclease/phosphatase family protein [bacterium]
MDALLKACEAASNQVYRLGLNEPIPTLLDKDPHLRRLAASISQQLHQGAEIYAPPAGPAQGIPAQPWKAVTWNIERGKNYPALLRALREDPRLNGADFYFLTEVDWGMARSENRNIAAELARELGYYAYFAPSYFNFTLGHGSERRLAGENQLGLHGKAILSRFRLEGVRAVPMSNAIDKLRSKEARLGQKCALLADLPVGGRRIALACTHLDAFSSPRARAEQLGRAIDSLRSEAAALVAGDWNTNTLNTTHGPAVLWSVLKQLLFTGPQAMIQRHYPGPEKKFDRPLFQMLRAAGFDFENCNEAGAGTYDLVSDDKDLGQMARDQFPDWIVRWINRQIQKGGGKISLKLDWFAAKGLNCLESRVIPLRSELDYPPGDRPSDHHPALLRFRLAE